MRYSSAVADGVLLPEQVRAVEYLNRKGTQAPADLLREQVRDAFVAVERAFDEIVPHERDARPAAGKWSSHDILDHLVLSHGPAVSQLECLLAGTAQEGSIPAGLHRDAA